MPATIHKSNQFLLPFGKVCTKCHIWQPLDNFYGQPNGLFGKKAECRKCAIGRFQTPKGRARARELRIKNREKCKEWARRWTKRGGKERKAAYAQSHRLQVRKTNRAWKKRNWLQVLASNSIYKRVRNARKRANGGTFSTQEWKALCAEYDNCCARCSQREMLTVDHVIPISKGGPNVINNIQPLCRLCNSIKGTDTTDYRRRSLRCLLRGQQLEK